MIVNRQKHKLGNFILKGLIFIVPFALYILFIFLIDPYEKFNISKFIDAETKLNIIRRSNESSPRGYMLWNAIHFKREPCSNLIIGDSQGRKLDEKLIKKLTGEDYFNYCVPGSSYETMFDIFWYAVDYTKLKNVYFQIGFMNYNLERSYNLFDVTRDYLAKPQLYFTRKEMFFDSFANFMYKITKNEKILTESFEDLKTEQDYNQLSGYLLNLFFGKYTYPEKYYKDLNKIADYCKENDINLHFIILPNYTEVHKNILERGLSEDYLRFKNDIYAIGTTYDFDLQTGSALVRSNFYDFFHPKQELADSISHIIWGTATAHQIDSQE